MLRALFFSQFWRYLFVVKVLQVGEAGDAFGPTMLVCEGPDVWMHLLRSA